VVVLTLDCFDVPESSGAFCAGLTGGLRQFVDSSHPPRVVADGALPHLQALHIDLSGTSVLNLDAPPPHQSSPLSNQCVAVDRLRVIGHPIYVQQLPIDVHLSADNVRFCYHRGTSGKLFLVPLEGHGRLTARIPVASLDPFVFGQLQQALASEGIEVHKTKLTLTSQSPRAIGAVIHIEAKRKLSILRVSARLNIHAVAEVDDDLNVVLSDIRCEGETAVSRVIAAFIASRLSPLNGYCISLAALGLQQTGLQDIRVYADETALQLESRLGLR
jgi:hypothetical protein